jgi:hypothetical protein
MSKAAIKLTVVPARGADADLALSDFLTQVGAVQQAIRQAYAPNDEALEICIVAVSMNSPITLALEPRLYGQPAEHVTATFISATKDAFQAGRAAKGLGRKFFDALHDLNGVVGKGVAKAIISTEADDVQIDLSTRDRFQSIFESDTITSGSIDGMLEAVNLHNKRNVCNLYPEVGASRIACRFTDDLFDTKVRPSLGKYVQIFGDLKYRWREPFPYEAQVSEIEVLDQDGLPNFADILGMAPNATNGKLSEEFVRERRHEWG